MTIGSQENKITILIVEDSPTQALMLKDSLEEHQFQVAVATNGIEGLHEMQKNPATLIISDIEMPQMNGYDLCKNIKLDPKFSSIPVILLTNLTDITDAIKGIECGADRFITKPCETKFLISTIQEVLDNRNRGNRTDNSAVEFSLEGKKHQIAVNQLQVTDLLLSTFSAAIQKNLELENAFRKLNLSHEEIERKNTLLENLNKEKNQFVGMAAHDLRNPLGVIQGYSKLLIEKFKTSQDETTLGMLEAIVKSSSFMLRLINELLDVSVIESGTVKLESTHFNIASLIREIFPLVNGHAIKKHISIAMHFSSDEIYVDGDKNKIEQVITNLLTNAIKFSHPQTSCEITLTSTPTEILLEVKDHGVGISEEKHLLFQPFMKTSSKATAKESSTGLGLTIVKKIVEAHKGKIWIESQLGIGTSVFVSFPIPPRQ